MVMPMTPPPAASSLITRSDLQRAWCTSAWQFEWVTSTGRRDAAIASRLVRSPQCETSMVMPTLFMAAMTSAPNGVRPLSAVMQP